MGVVEVTFARRHQIKIIIVKACYRRVKQELKNNWIFGRYVCTMLCVFVFVLLLLFD